MSAKVVPVHRLTSGLGQCAVLQQAPGHYHPVNFLLPRRSLSMVEIDIIDSDSEQAEEFNPADWIGVGKLYRDVPTHVSAACKAARALPTSSICRLPLPDMTVTEFLSLPLPEILHNDAPFPKRPSTWFSLDLPNCDEEMLWSIKSISPLEFICRLENDFSQAWLNGTCSIVDHTHPDRRLPLTALTFFREIITLHDAQQKWTESRSWLPTTEKYLLDYVSWNSRHTGAPDGQLYWTRLIGDEWLSGDIIDEMMRDIKTRLSEDPELSSSTFVAPLAFQFYITRLATHGTDTKHYLDEIVAEVQAGKTKMLFPIHHNRNHWMAFVIDFSRRTFGFGDSYFRTSTPKKFIWCLEQWLAARFPGEFTNLGDVLEHAFQTDYVHCGVYAINTIERVLFGTQILMEEGCQDARLNSFKKMMARAANTTISPIWEGGGHPVRRRRSGAGAGHREPSTTFEDLPYQISTQSDVSAEKLREF
ncbi:hypothetical protein B0H13DRAFT_2513072 [Mycena leptocephala]|nr:hypothetical protein B0H13DRAFT_2513072 [Mycena leptocephala]